MLTVRLAVFVSLSALAVSSAGLAPMTACAAASSARAVIEGPIKGGSKGFPYSASIVDLAPYGYQEAEYFIAGKARPYQPAPGTTLSEDGRWSVVAGDAVPYKTRILVRTPPADKFNGTVIVEFMQEYFGSERDTNFRWNAEALLREGYAWVGASLHREGINDPTPPQTFTYGNVTFTTGMTLARWDADRYGTLNVPSSDLSFDILTQVGRAVGPKRPKGGVDPLRGLPVQRVLAVGNTIAAERLAIYINGIQPLERAFHGFFLQDLVPGKLQLSKGVPTPTGKVRTDTDVPVVVLQTTTAAVQVGTQPEGKNLRFWHPAGSSHTTGPYVERINKANQRDLGAGSGAGCPADYANTLPVQYISSAAIVSIDRWIKDGVAAPSFPQLPAAAQETVPASYFDANGNVLGGLRNPWVDVPVARYDWRGECMGGSGRTYPFSANRLRQLYGTPEQYHAKFEAAVREAQVRGILLPEDAEAAIQNAKKIGW